MKTFVTSLMLAALVATPAFAAKKRQTMSPEVTAAQASMPNGQAYYGLDGYTVIDSGQIVGRDPDPNVRLMLLRDSFTQ